MVSVTIITHFKRTFRPWDAWRSVATKKTCWLPRLSIPHWRRRPAPPPTQSRPRPRPRERRAAPSPSISRPDAIPSEGSAFRTIPSATRPRNLFQDFMATLPRPFPISAATGTTSPVSSPSSASTRSALSLSYHLQLAHHLQGRHILTLC